VKFSVKVFFLFFVPFAVMGATGIIDLTGTEVVYTELFRSGVKIAAIWIGGVAFTVACAEGVLRVVRKIRERGEHVKDVPAEDPPGKGKAQPEKEDPRGKEDAEIAVRLPIVETGFYRAWERVVSGERPDIPKIKETAALKLRTSEEGSYLLDSMEKVEKEIKYLFDVLSEEERKAVFDFTRSFTGNMGVDNWLLRDYQRIYGLRATARNMFVAAHAKKEVPENIEKLIRGISYSAGLLSHLMEKNILIARAGMSADPSFDIMVGIDIAAPASPGKNISKGDYTGHMRALPTYRDVLQSKVKKMLKGAVLRKIEPEGSQMVAYGAPDLPFVVKIVKEGALNDRGEPVDFDKDIRSGIRLARQRLGGLAANTMVIDNLTVNMDGEERTLEKAVIQSRVVPIREKMADLDRDPNRGREEAKRIVTMWWRLQKEMWARGIVDGGIKIFDNYGYDEESDRVVIFDLTNITDDRRGFWSEEHYQNIIDTFRIANISMLNASAPGIMPGEMYSSAEFDIMSGVDIIGAGRDISVSVWPSAERVENESSFVPLSDPFMVDSIEYGRMKIIMERLLRDPSLLGARMDDSAVSGMLYELEKSMLWLGAERHLGLSTLSAVPSAGALKREEMASRTGADQPELGLIADYTGSDLPISPGKVPPEIESALSLALSERDKLRELGIKYDEIENIDPIHVENLIGRDIVTVLIKTPHGQEKIGMILYRGGYNLDSSITDPHVRVAARVVELYRHLKLDHLADRIKDAGIDIDTVKRFINDVFRHKILEQELEFFDAGGDATVYANPTREIVVKDLREHDKDIIRRPEDSREEETGPVAGYNLARDHLGHLFIRFMRVDGLKVRVRKNDGTLEERTIARGIIQKKVPVFFKEKEFDPAIGARRFEGILADAIRDGRMGTARMLIDEFLVSIRSMMARGVFDWDVKTENYGYDETQGHMGSLDAGKFMRASLAEQQHGRVFIRNLQAARDDIKRWAKIVATDKDAEELVGYFEKRARGIFSDGGFIFDLTKDVREIEEDEDFSEVVRWSLSQDLQGMPVCYTGTETMRREAARRIAVYLSNNTDSINISRAERIFAEMGVSRMDVEKARSDLMKKSYLKDESVYIPLKSPRYAGAKMRRLEKHPKGSEAVLRGSYGDEKLSPEAFRGIKKDMLKQLFYFYDHAQSYYDVLAREFGLKEGVEINDKLSVQIQLDKIEAGELTAGQKDVLKTLLGIKEYSYLNQRLTMAFDDLRALRRYPFDITLDNFIIRKEEGGFTAEIEAFGSYIRTARENEIVQHMKEYLNMPYDIIFDALEEEKGLENALVFAEKVYYQEEEGSPLREYAHDRIGSMFTRMGGRIRARTWVMSMDAGLSEGHPLVVGVPADIYRKLKKSGDMDSLLAELGKHGAVRLVPVIHAGDSGKMVEEMSRKAEREFLGAVIAPDVFDGVRDEDLVRETKAVIIDFAVKAREHILPGILSNVEGRTLPCADGARLGALDDLAGVARTVIRLLPEGMSYDLGQKSLRELRIDQMEMEQKYAGLKSGIVNYPIEEDKDGRPNYFVHFAEVKGPRWCRRDWR